MRWFWIVVIIVVVSAVDRTYMDGQTAAYMISGARSLAATFNREVNYLLRHLRQ